MREHYDGDGVVIEFSLNGPLSIRDASGRDLRPKLLKSRAILAILAATPGNCQSRSWLQSLLWQDRQQAQAMSSLRSALADIRRHLGGYSIALRADHHEVSLDPSMIQVAQGDNTAIGSQSFLQGFDVPNAKGFEDWVRSQRNPVVSTVEPVVSALEEPKVHCRIFLAASSQMDLSVPRMQCDALVDCIAKSAEDLGLAEVVDGRGAGLSFDDFRVQASNAQCDIILISETAENPAASITRIKVLTCETGTLVWSKSLVGDPVLDLDHPSNVSVVAEFIEALTERLVRPVDWRTDALSPQMMAITGMNHIFKLGQNNFSTADMLLKRSYFENPNGCTLAWRAFLRTFLIAEREYHDHAEVIEEGDAMARQAMEAEPLNSMVLALCGHVQAMLRDDYENAVDLAARSLSLNRCNPIAWACLGRAASFLGDVERGQVLAQYGASLAKGTKYSFLVDSWASSSGLLAQDLVSARLYCEASHVKAPTFAPPLRFLSALYCADSQFDRADSMVQKLKKQESDFNLHRLLDDGYPSDTLRRAKILDSLPVAEI